jgi:hypothetical protein
LRSYAIFTGRRTTWKCNTHEGVYIQFWLENLDGKDGKGDLGYVGVNGGYY